MILSASLGALAYVQHSTFLLAEFQDAHSALLQSMANLDALTRGPVPSNERIVEARWNISRKSLARRMLWKRVHSYLSLDQRNEKNAADLQRLYDNDLALLRSSSEHVSKWTIDAILQAWPDYCEASKRIRWKMKAAIGAEQRPPLSNAEG